MQLVKFIVPVLTSLLLVTPAAAKSKLLLTVADISNSSLLTVDSAYAGRVANVVIDKIVPMKAGDQVRFRTLGAYDAKENNSIVFNSTISNRDRPKLIASRLGRYVASFPTLISSGKIKAGGSTHIIDTLVELSPTLDCEAQDTTIQVLTDGLETSGDGTKFNEKKGTITLPTYGAGEFKGCHLEMYGIGKLSKNSNARLTRALRTAWTKWAKSAGFKSVRLFSNW